MIPLLILLLLILLLLLFQYLSLVFTSRYSAKIPTVKPNFPLLGQAPLMWRKNSRDAFRLMYDFFTQVDRAGKMMIGPKPVILVNHPDLVQQVLTRNDMCGKPFFYDFLGIKGGLMAKSGMITRKALNPTFNTRVLTNFVPIMDARAKKLVETMRPLADSGEKINILEYLSECTLEMVFSTTMGRKAYELPGQKDYVKHLESVLTRLGERIVDVSQFLGVFYRMTDAYKKEQISRKFCDKFTDNFILERRQELQQDAKPKTVDDEYEAKSLNFLDQILTIRKSDGTFFGDQEIANNLYNVMAGGNDTSALTVSFACLFLAMNPDIQANVFAEISAIFDPDRDQMDLSLLKQLKYTERFLKEVLRLCPAVPFVARETSTESRLQLDGVKIPPNQILAFNLFTLHRRPDFWGPDPERFDPDRFLPEAVEQRHPYAYVPFSAGVRNCIGYRYAKNSLLIMLVRILQQFELGTDLKQEQLRYKYEISLKLVGPHSVWLKKRGEL
ncbi:hypothetical protein pipiens_013640 [Culex pipiens pipiens]|uniref:Cytochrome P450 n=1 Tax=Culex pipiens pipiens TaxID=38569 RepID=A0ABD1CY55_CULPP